MKEYNLFLCKSLNKRAYQYKGGEFHHSWKLKEQGGDTLYDTYEDFLASKAPKSSTEKIVARKKAAVKKKAIKKES